MKKYKNTKDNKSKSYQRKIEKLSLYLDEISLDGREYRLPEWVFNYRNDLLVNLLKRDYTLYDTLKENEIPFKVKYPVYSNGKWKFGDVYIPKYNLIVLIMNHEEIFSPVCSTFERTNHFKKYYKVKMILPEEVGNIVNIISEFPVRDYAKQ